MDKPRALVLMSSGKAPFERARRQLSDRVGYTDVVAGVDVPDFTACDATLRAVDRLMARTPFQHVVATSESNMAFAAYLRGRYGLCGLTFEQTLIATNKWRMKQAVGKAFPTGQSWLSGEFGHLRGARPAEVVIKPLASSSARGVRRLPVAEALAWLHTADDIYLVEEALDVSGELHCDGLVRNGALEWVVVSSYDRPVLRSFGTRASMHLPHTDPRVATATKATQRVIEAFSAGDFVFHLELLDVQGDLLFGEIGLRPAGTGIAESIQRCFGADLWLHFVGLQTGIDLPVAPPSALRDALCGVIMARPSEHGEPLTAGEAETLPGITGIASGNLKPGQPPAHMCSYHYLAFYEDLTFTELSALMTQIGQAPGTGPR